MCSDSEKNMSAFADQNHTPSLTCVRLECMGEFNMNDGQKLPVNVSLAQSFKKLACEQPVEKITIKQITDGAGVIRPTFYHHFSDKYGLLEWILVQDILLPIQPLVENAIIHGVENIEQGVVVLDVQKVKDRVRICVSDNGVGMEQSKIDEILGEDEELIMEAQDSIGLRNVNRRLKIRYGESHGLVIESVPGSGTRICIWIPMTENAEDNS